MDRYQRVEKPRPESAINENEVRITTQGLIRNYISYATNLLQERRVSEIVLKAMGQAISKTVAIAEILKKRIPGLHQDTSISSVSITDVWEPIEEGLVPLEMTRHVSMISISLSTRELNNNSPGYQAPEFIDQPRQQRRYNQPQQRRYNQPPQQPQLEYSEDAYGRGRGRGGRMRGRGGRGGGRGWGNRGGYGGYNNNYNNNNYNNNYDGGYGNNNYNQGGGYRYNQGRYGGGGGGYGYGNYQENDGYGNWGRGGGGGMRGRGNYAYRGGYERGRGGVGPGGRGYNRGRGGRMGGGRGRATNNNQA